MLISRVLKGAQSVLLCITMTKFTLSNLSIFDYMV